MWVELLWVFFFSSRFDFLVFFFSFFGGLFGGFVLWGFLFGWFWGFFGEGVWGRLPFSSFFQ